MIFYPAIDLKDGNCVRLCQGDLNQSTIYSDAPTKQAQIFADAGAEYLHMVDLDGAFHGDRAEKSPNRQAVEQILRQQKIAVQLGGGIRSLASMEHWLSLGVRRLVVGTLAIKNPALLREACQKFPGKIALGLDARHGKVAVEGWAQTALTRAEDLARAFEDAGVAAIIYTDIERDGMMQGPNIDGLAAMVACVKTPIIASGGVSSLQDLCQLRDQLPQLDGVISGRAIYEGKINLKDAIAVLKSPPGTPFPPPV